MSGPCPTCHATVELVDQRIHREWHDALDELLLKLAAAAIGVPVDDLRAMKDTK